MSTKLGTAKVYFTKEDLGKMLKLKDKDNLMVTDVQVDNVEGKVAITITTPMDNITNDRVKFPDGTARKRLSSELFSDKIEKRYQNMEYNDFTEFEIRNYIKELCDPIISSACANVTEFDNKDMSVALWINGNYYDELDGVINSNDRNDMQAKLNKLRDFMVRTYNVDMEIYFKNV